MTREEVAELLGPPERTRGEAGGHVGYVIGSEASYFNIDHEWLWLDLEDGKVVGLAVAPD